jgi:D-arabinose 1-dehydrogenase-like Zn-dependent alcohol dehydrogenase
MKAIVIHAYGGPEVLSYEEVPDPVPRPGEIVVEVRAVSIQRVLDVEVRKGTQGRRNIKLPLVPGVDPSGIVVAVGDKVPGLAVGDPVVIAHHVACGDCAACLAGEPAGCTTERMLGIHRWGGDAQYVRVPYTSAYKIPSAWPSCRRMRRC